MKDAPHAAIKYQLKKLEVIIKEEIPAFIKQCHQPDQNLIDQFQQTLRLEAETIKANLKQLVFYVQDERDIALNIQFHQQALINLAGQLLNHAIPAYLYTLSNPLSAEAFSYHSYQTIQNLLRFIHKHFPEYADKNVWMPASYRKIIRYQIGADLQELNDALKSHGTNDQLLAVTFLPLQQFKEKDYQKDITYSHTTYLIQLKKQLHRAANTSSVTDINETIHLALYNLNFNSTDYYNYCINHIKADVYGTDAAIPDQICKLSLYRKILTQRTATLSISFNPHRPPLSSQLLQWIDEEAVHLKQRERADKIIINQPENSPQRYRIKTMLPISQLSYLLRVLIAVGVFVVGKGNKSRFLRFVANTFQSVNQENPSQHSIRKKLYIVEDSTRVAVREILLRAVEYVDMDLGGVMEPVRDQ